MRIFLHKLTHWEYWPFQIIYIPVYFLWIYYSVKAGTVFFFNAANPSIKNGGFMSESKKEIYDIIPPQYYPATLLIKEGSTADHAVAKSAALKFPIIAKPDIGLRGSAVKKIYNEEELLAYHKNAKFDYLLQEFIGYQYEAGIFYVRYPGQKRGRITGIVSKQFLKVEGDGQYTIESLLKKDPRHEMQLKVLRKEYGKRLDEILQNGEKVNLVPYGNHARGAKFTDDTSKVSEELTNVFDQICGAIPGFYFGRLDVMYDTFEQLEKGMNFTIVELNGSGSEPTHIYDPKHSLFFAWKELCRHIRYMYEIGAENHKSGTPYLTYSEGIAQFKIHLSQSRKITSF